MSFTLTTCNANIVQHGQHGEGFVLCAPDKGARPFVTELFERLVAKRSS